MPYKYLNLIWILVFLIWSMMGFLPLAAQGITSGADFLKIDSSARSAGMGSAFTAVADDPSALTWNPAGLSLVPQPQLGYLYMLYLGNISYNFGGGVYPFQDGRDHFAVGAAVINLGTGTFDSTLGAQPAVSAGEDAFQISFAYRSGDQLALGVSTRYILEQIAGYNAGDVAGDFGLLWTPQSWLRIGGGIFNVGPAMDLNSVPDALPTTGRLGLSLQWEGRHQSLLASVEGDYDLNQSILTGSVGAEYCYDHLLALRAGYTGSPYEDNYTVGLGIDLKVVQIDYAYAPLSMLGDSHRFSLTLRLDEAPKLRPTPATTPAAITAVVTPTPVPASPRGFHADLENGRIRLDWDDKPLIPVAGYDLYLGDIAGQKGEKLSAQPLTRAPVGIKTVPAGKTYRFFLTSVRADGVESQPAMAEITVPTQAP